MPEYDNFNTAYIDTLDIVFNQADFFNSPRGFNSREKLNYHLSLKDPTQRIYYGKERKTNIVFNFAEVLWYLTGNNQLDYITYYNKRMPLYSMNGRTLTGTAYGAKIFRYGNSKINQWNNIKNILKADPDSKRAFIQIFDATELVIQDNIDVSCTLGMQFFIREGQLHAASFMRANDAFRGMISDVFSFTFIQELMARDLGLAIGNFYHNVGTIHIYEPDNPWVKRVLNSDDNTDFKFPEMPAVDNWAMIHTLSQYEESLRKNTIELSWNDIKKTRLSDYWQQILALFSLYQMIHYHKKIDISLYQHLIPAYRYLMVNKWPEYFNKLQ